MDWRLHSGGARCRSLGLTTLARAMGRIAPCALSLIKRPVHRDTNMCHSSYLEPRLCAAAGSRRVHVKRTAAVAASAEGPGGSGALVAAAFASDPLSGNASTPSGGPSSATLEGSLDALFEACGGPSTPAQQQLLVLEAQLAGGVLQRMNLEDQSGYVAESLSILAQASSVWCGCTCAAVRRGAAVGGVRGVCSNTSNTHVPVPGPRAQGQIPAWRAALICMDTQPRTHAMTAAISWPRDPLRTSVLAQTTAHPYKARYQGTLSPSLLLLLPCSLTQATSALAPT